MNLIKLNLLKFFGIKIKTKKDKISWNEFIQHTDTGNAPHLLSKKDKETLDKANIIRVSGRSVCKYCKKSYSDHGQVKGALWLTRLCDGRLVKL